MRKKVLRYQAAIFHKKGASFSIEHLTSDLGSTPAASTSLSKIRILSGVVAARPVLFVCGV